MKRLSDYKDESAIELWADLLEPIATIISDKKLKEIYGKQPNIFVAKYILKNHKTEAKQILLAIDDTPITAVNIFARILSFLADINNAPEFKDFLQFAEQENKDNVSFGSATENIKENEN